MKLERPSSACLISVAVVHLGQKIFKCVVLRGHSLSCAFQFPQAVAGRLNEPLNKRDAADAIFAATGEEEMDYDTFME